jgi:glyoxylase-like metal-dependent hydrolase (beta-lactamase superfamily II)
MVTRWDLITVGNLSRNRYWGDDESKPARPTLCTSTLIRGDGFSLLVDPSCEDGERMAAELNRRSGLKLEQIDTVFLTHDHGDHHYGLRHFPGARWYAAEGVAAKINEAGQYDRKVEPAPARLFDCIEVIPTPGHTVDHHSLRFECEGLWVVIAGDAVMTRDFWRDRRGFPNSVDIEQAGRTIERLAEVADAIAPGHDNWFLTGRGR